LKKSQKTIYGWLEHVENYLQELKMTRWKGKCREKWAPVLNESNILTAA
jgi:hypothetical protein